MKGTLPHPDRQLTEGTRSYKKVETGNRVWKYDVTGTKEEIEAFKAAQDKVIINEFTGNPIFFSVTNYGETVQLGISSKGSVYANTEAMDALRDKIEQMGPEFAKALASEMAKEMLGTPVSAPISVAEPVQEDSAEDLSDI